MIWSEAVKLYEDVHSSQHHAPSTRKLLKEVMGNVHAEFSRITGEADFDLAKLTRLHCERLLGAIKSKGLASATVNKYARKVKAFLNWAYLNDLIPKNPFKGLRLLKVIKRSAEEKVITPEQFRQIIEHIRKGYGSPYQGNAYQKWGKADHNRRAIEDMAVLVWHTGLRLGEARWLRAEDVDFKNRVLWVKNREEHLTKDREDRDVPLNKAALDLLRRRVEQAKDPKALGEIPLRGSSVSGPNPLLFPNTQGNVLNSIEASRDFGTHCKAAGVAHCNWHVLRHSFATRNAEFYTPYQLMKLLGHSSTETTNQHYVHRQAMNLKPPPDPSEDDPEALKPPAGWEERLEALDFSAGRIFFTPMAKQSSEGYEYPKPGENWAPEEVDVYLQEHHEAPEGRTVKTYDRAVAKRFWDARFKVLTVGGGDESWIVQERIVDSLQLMQLLHGYGEGGSFLISVQPVEGVLRREVDRLHQDPQGGAAGPAA